MFLKKILLLGAFLLLISSAMAAVEPYSSITLSPDHKIYYLSYCDLDKNGLKDIVVADKFNISIFLQMSNKSFTKFTIKSTKEIIAMNSLRLSSNRQIIACLGQNSIFYFSWNKETGIEGPSCLWKSDNYALIEKSKNLKNFNFVTDLDSDGEDEIIIPENEGILILWLKDLSNIHTSFISLTDNAETFDSRIQPWIESNQETPNAYDKGFFFSPSFYKNVTYWLQDFNNDNLLDIISIIQIDSKPTLKVYIQNIDHSFKNPQIIALPSPTDKEFDEFNLLSSRKGNPSDLVATSIARPMRIDDPIFPILKIAFFKGKKSFQFDNKAYKVLKTTLLPGLNNILSIDNKETYGILFSPPSLKISSKESILEVLRSQKISFTLSYIPVSNSQTAEISNINKNFIFSISKKNLEESNQFIKMIDFDEDGIKDFCILKENNTLEISTIKKKDSSLHISKMINIPMPYKTSEITFMDINSNEINEILAIDSSSKILTVIYPGKI